MKRYMITTIIALIAMPLWAAQNSVFDITQGGGLRLTAGKSFIVGSCDFNWTDPTLKKSVKGLFEGATSYEWDAVQGASSINCVNLKADISDIKVNVPLVNPALFQNRSNVKSLAFSGNTIIRISESQTEPNATYITAGTFGTTNYFFCELPTRNPQATNKSLELEWLLMTGAEKKLSNGWILSMTWFGAERKCANMTMSFDPSLLTGSVVVPPVTPPVSCNPGCVAAP